MKACLYARFSKEKQSESSIEDQVRVCSGWCERNQATVIARFEDQGISGAAIGNRPGLQAALGAAVDVLVVMDLTRLSRSQADLPKLIDRLVHRGVRVVGVQDGYDSARKGHKLQAGLTGIIGEAFREMVAEKTYTALESRAQAGKPTGGRAYGYRNGEAEVVHRIFRMYADGVSAKRIAETLNREAVPSPGSSWARTTRRRSGWHPSAIAGDPRRGIGLLNCELYRGVDIWNRSKWIKDPDSGRRRAVQRPRSEWIVREVPELRLIQDDLWNAVKARQERRQRDIGEAVRRGLKRGTGRAARYLFSTILKCKVCGSNYVQRGATHYVCSGYENGRVCSNSQTFRRDVMEFKLLTAIRNGLLSDASVERFKAKVLRRLRQPAGDSRRVGKLEKELANIVDTIAQGIRSSALIERLHSTESELEGLKAAAKVVDVTAIAAAIPAAVARYREMVSDLGNAPIDIEQGREIIRGIADYIPVRPGPDGVPIAELALNEAIPLAAVGSDIGMVAGARFDTYLHGFRAAKRYSVGGICQCSRRPFQCPRAYA
jgi:site-specific DNA recombinase